MSNVLIVCAYFLIAVDTLRSMSTVRLNGGHVPTAGRLEVWYNETWGTVCDDGFNDTVCVVVCKRLGFSGGQCINEDGSNSCVKRTEFTKTSRESPDLNSELDKYQPIWLDDVVCSGEESDITECRHNAWGDTDCTHKEDAGCICTVGPTLSPIRGICKKSNHRITPFNPSVPNMGRVEVKNDKGDWGLICDDEWDDLDAIVFCDCLGYRGHGNFRALSTPNHTSGLPIHYDAVHCSVNDTLLARNIWQCNASPADGRCDPQTEAAGVLCGPLPTRMAPAIPDVTMTCNGSVLVACLRSITSHPLSADNIHLNPICSDVVLSRTSQGDVCLQIDMAICPHSHKKINRTANHYCYDVTTSRSGVGAFQLLTDSSWTQRLCCVIAKNGTVTASFLPRMDPSPVVFAENPEASTFEMSCYRAPYEEAHANSALTYPAVVERGETLLCNVAAKNIWDPRLILIVTDCRFTSSLASNNHSMLEFQFIKNKCPTTDDLGLVFHPVNSVTWGFKFHVPKFDAHNELYVVCDALTCDRETEDNTKDSCDRSCMVDFEQIGKKMKRALGVVDGPAASELLPENQITASETAIRGGPFVVEDNGRGPLITVEHRLLLVQHTNDAEMFDLNLPVPSVACKRYFLRNSVRCRMLIVLFVFMGRFVTSY